MLAGSFVVLIAPLLAAAVPSAPTSAAADLGRGYGAFHNGDYGAAIRPLRASLEHGLLNRDYALFLLAESEFYDGRLEAARGHFEALARIKQSRFAGSASWRAADCLWAAGQKAAAGSAYSTLLKKDPRAGDSALARFRIATLAAAARPAEGRRLLLALYADFPAHPLAAEALRLAAKIPGATPAQPNDDGVDARTRLKRAVALSEGRRWQEALDELGKLDADLPEELQAERDYHIGMTKYRMRRDYAGAAKLLLAASPRLAGERAASAAFHGARALSRADQDDEAIRRYGDVVRLFPRSRWAAEAQFLSGWLDFNRGRYRQGLEALRATVDGFPRSAFADDAAWYLAFAHYLLGEWSTSLEALDRYSRIAPADAAARVGYWRARVLVQLDRQGDAVEIWRDVARRWPLGYYGVAARARLAAAGERTPIALPHKEVALPPVVGALARDAAKDPTVARADELLSAGLDAEGGRELERDESAVLRRLGKDRGLAVLLDRYRATSSFRRAYQLAEKNGGALAAEPVEGARRIWEAAYPRAYEEIVERYAAKAGNPDHLLYAIMRKESGFGPHEVSYADARGLLQMIPPTSARVAATAGVEFHDDELFEPETNIRFGAAYIGSLFRAFGGQIPLAAGAYNAGPNAMARWCGQHDKRPLDELVELVTYSQTREYMKRVVAIYARYRHLYGPSPYELPVTVSGKPAADRPDF